MSATCPDDEALAAPAEGGAEYVPKHIRKLAARLVADHNLDQALADMRAHYTNLTSLRGALTKLKSAVIGANVRHPCYDKYMAAWEERVNDEVVKEIASASSLQRLREFYAFRDCSLRRQLHIQKKIQLGQGQDFFSRADDADFVATTLRVAPDFVHRIHLDAEEARCVQEDHSRKMKHLSSTVIRIENVDEIVALARRHLKQPDQNLLGTIVSVAIVTGRRMIEILMKGAFSETPHDRYSVNFSGQAKAGLQEIVSIQHNRPVHYTVPVLAPAAHIVQAIAVIRTQCKSETLDAKRMNTLWCKKLNAYVRQHVHRDLGFHDMRTLYALTSYEAFKPHTYSINGWICKTLGHTGLNMSVSYTRMQVYGIHKIRRHHRELTEDFSMEKSQE